MGDGLFGWVVNTLCVLWTLFISVLFCMPNYLPVDKNNMNYASVRTLIRPFASFSPFAQV